MKWKKAIGEATALGSIIILIYFFVVATVNGLFFGSYEVTMFSNKFYEHYFEFGLVVVGLVCYVTSRKIKFTLHPKKAE